MLGATRNATWRDTKRVGECVVCVETIVPEHASASGVC